MEIELVPKNNLVIKSNNLIKAIYSLNLQEQRIVLILISLINPKLDTEFKFYRMPIDIFKKAIGLKGDSSYSELKRTTKKLMERVLEIPRPNDGLLQLSWLSSCEYKKDEGVIELEISAKLAPYLLDLKTHYTSYRLRNVLPLKSSYSIRLYELLKQYEKLKERYFEVQELRDILKIPNSKYKLYTNFKNRIIVSAQKELNKTTDISFTFKERTGKRNKVLGIRFFIKANKKDSAIDMIQVDGTAVSEDDILSSIANDNLYTELIQLGISPGQIKSYLNKYDEPRLIENIKYIKFKISYGKVRDVTGFAISAIEKNWKRQTTIDDYLDKKNREKAKQQEALQEANRIRPGTICEYDGKQYIFDTDLNISDPDWVNPMPVDFFISLLATGKAKIVSQPK